MKIGEKVKLKGNPWDEQIEGELEKYMKLKNKVMTVKESLWSLTKTDLTNQWIDEHWFKVVKPKNEKVKPVICDCDMRYIVQGSPEETIKKFFASHPFMTGYIGGYGMRKDVGGEKILELINKAVEENYGKPNGWGRR